jgi:hypothetical protein
MGGAFSPNLPLGRLHRAAGILFGCVPSQSDLVTWTLNGTPTSNGTFNPYAVNPSSTASFQDFVPTPNGAFAFAVDYHHLLELFSLNGSGAVTDSTRNYSATNSATTLSAVVHPNGQYIYVQNTDSDVDIFGVSAVDGTLTHIGDVYPALYNGSFENLVIDPTGSFLYGSSDGGNASSNQHVQGFQVSPSGGALTSMNQLFSTVSGSKYVKGLAFAAPK